MAEILLNNVTTSRILYHAPSLNAVHDHHISVKFKSFEFMIVFQIY